MRRKSGAARKSTLTIFCVTFVAHLDAVAVDVSLLTQIAQKAECQNPSAQLMAMGCILAKLYPPQAGFEKKDRVGKTNLDVYGEVLPEGVQQLLDAIPVYPFAEDDSFFDLGSGVGKVPMQVFLSSKVRRAVGVELDISRHEHATRAMGVLMSLFPTPLVSSQDDAIDWEGRQLKFINGDILQTKLSEATVIFIASLAFPSDLVQAVQEHLAHSALPGTIVMVQSKFKGCPKGVVFMGEAKVAVSWLQSATIYIYLVATPKDMAQKLISGGSASIHGDMWGVIGTQLQRLRTSIDERGQYIALNRENGDKSSGVHCDAANLIASVTHNRSKLNADLQNFDLSRVDSLGRNMFWYVCDVHITTVSSISAFGQGNKFGAKFAQDQEEKQRNLLELIHVLLERRADPHALDTNGHSILQETQNRADTPLLEMLQGRASPNTDEL